MSVVRLSQAARADLREIRRFSAPQWSERQADRYIARFHTVFWMLAANPRRAPASRDAERYRQFAVGSHMIFFRVIDEGIGVVRVLHQNMDFERHLRETE